MKCRDCLEEIPEERLKALPETKWCVKCAVNHVVKKRAFVSGTPSGKGHEVVIVDGDSHAAKLWEDYEKEM